MIPLMSNYARPLPSDDDPEERQRQAKLALMGVRSRLAGGIMGLNPNDPDYLSKLERMGSASHLVGMHAADANQPDLAELQPAGLKMGKSSLMPVGNLPLTRNVQDAAPLDRPAAVTMGARDRMARPAAAVAAPAPTEAEMPTTLVPPEREPFLANEAPSMGKQRSFMGRFGHGLERALYHIGDIAGSTFFPEAMAVTPGTTIYKNLSAARAERNKLAEERSQSELMDAEARMGEAQARMGAAPRERTVTIGGKPVVQQWERGRGWLTEPGIEPYKSGTQRTTPDEQLIQAEQTLANPAASVEEKQQAQSYIDAAGKARGILHPGQQRILTNPFEASIYGTPEQKRAAQDFLAFEKRIGARYQRPTEFDERYRLFTEHPDIYKAMYGTKGGISTAEARMMLNYFDKRRQEISKDYTLSDADRQQELQEIEQLEQPFMQAAQRAAAGQGAGAPDSGTVNVISPDGRPGTIPRANLQKALKRGYKLPLQGKSAQ